jgi:hypothetical protein
MSTPPRSGRVHKRLQGAVDELLTSDGWKRWLRTRAVLGRGYSANNTVCDVARSDSAESAPEGPT